MPPEQKTVKELIASISEKIDDVPDEKIKEFSMRFGDSSLEITPYRLRRILENFDHFLSVTEGI